MIPSARAIRFQHPEFPLLSDVGSYFAASEDAGWFSNFGPCNQLLCERLTERTGASCTPVSSGTIGLAVALQAVRRPRCRKVLVPSFTFAAAPGVIKWCGLEPVFVDIEPGGWHVSPASLDEGLARYGNDVAAVIVGSSFGIPPSVQHSSAWRELCQARGVPLIVDSAAGFGSVRSDGQPLGLQGDAEVFSLHATKPFAIGEGGLVTTARSGLHQEIQRLINFGFNSARIVDQQPGINGKLSELQAATALAVLDTFDHVLETRRLLAAEYTRLFVSHGWSVQNESQQAAWQFFPVLAPSAHHREHARARCEAGAIETRCYYQPLHRQPGFQRCERVGSLSVTEDIASRTLSLPLFNSMTVAAVRRVFTTALS